MNRWLERPYISIFPLMLIHTAASLRILRGKVNSPPEHH